MGFRWFNSGLGIAERLKKATNSKKALMLLLFFIFVCLPVIGYVANVAIDAQTKTTELATDDVFPIYDTSNTGGRGIYMSDLAEDIADDVAANIAEGELANSIVISADIKDGTIDSADYANLSIDAAHLAADVIDETKLADDSIDSEHYNDGSIDAAHLAADVIDETKIADNGIDSEHYNDKSIDPEHIALNEGQILVGQATTNQAGAQAIIPNLTIDATADGMTDDNWSGIGISGIASGDDALLQWQIVFYDSSVARWELADATAASGEYPAWGIATAAKDDGEELIVCIRCVVRNEGWTGLTPGAPIYLGETDGLLTETVPTTANDCVQIIGFALSDSEILFDFSRPYQLVQ